MDQTSLSTSDSTVAAEQPAPRSAESFRIRSPRNRLNPRFILWRTLNTLFWAIGVIGVLVTLYAIFPSIRTWLGPITWFFAGVFLVNLLFMPTYRYWVHRWETTDQMVYALSGWISREWRIVPISRIQSIDTLQGPLERALRLATIKVSTASGEGSVKIEGLDTEVAKDAVRHLNEITQITPGDAT
ncbi:MAG: PH domain-containing protein [Kibdelosporangium sp.]